MTAQYGNNLTDWEANMSFTSSITVSQIFDAGEAGNGFAAVASEVKNLANQTARATEQIEQQINGIQNATSDAVQAIGNIGKIVSEIDTIATGISSAMEEQGAATEEIARNTGIAADGADKVHRQYQRSLGGGWADARLRRSGSGSGTGTFAASRASTQSSGRISCWDS